MITFKQHLLESITPTSREDMIKYLYKLIDRYGLEIDPYGKLPKSKIMFNFSDDMHTELIQYLEPELKKRNWFISNFGIGWLNIEPHGGKSISISRYRYIYHLTTELNMSNIQKKGLIPGKSSGNRFKHPERTYFFPNEDNIPYVKDYVRNNKSSNTLKVIKINTSQLGKQVKFYRDPRLSGSIYTKSHIPASAIDRIIDYADF